MSVKQLLTRMPLENVAVLTAAFEYATKASFSRGRRVELGDVTMLFISSTPGMNEKGESIHSGNFMAQAERTFDNLTGSLESEDADWHDLARTPSHLADFRHGDRFNEVRNAFYEQQQLDPLPAGTCIEAGICRPELQVEIEAVAVKSRDRPPGAPDPPAPQTLED